MLGQRLPGDPCTVTTTVTLEGEGRAGLAVVGDTYACVALESTPDGARLVCGDAEPVPVEAGAPITIGARIGEGALVTFLADTGDGPRKVGEPFQATQGRWVGAVIGLFAAGSGTGQAIFDAFTVDIEGRSQ